MESVLTFLEEHRCVPLPANRCSWCDLIPSSASSVPRQVELHIKNWIRFQYPQQRADAQVPTRALGGLSALLNQKSVFLAGAGRNG